MVERRTRTQIYTTDADRLARVRRVEKLRERGYTLPRIADALNVSVRRLQRDLEQSDRAARIIAYRVGGSTLEEIGAVMGITRERVRQIEKAFGGKVAKDLANATGDPVALLTAIRSAKCTAITPAATMAKCSIVQAETCLRALGMLPAVRRLFRLRKFHNAIQYPSLTAGWQARSVQEYLALREELGRAPLHEELHAARARYPLMAWSTRIKVWGRNSLTKLRDAAHETPLLRGALAHKHPEVKLRRVSWNAHLQTIRLASFGRTFLERDLAAFVNSTTRFKTLRAGVQRGFLQVDLAETRGHTKVYSKME